MVETVSITALYKTASVVGTVVIAALYKLPPSWEQWSILPYTKIVSMIRKYHNHKPQTTPWYRKEEPLNHHETPGTQIKQSN